jgi:integrase
MKRNDVRVPAFIFTTNELNELLNASRTTAPRKPIRGITLHSMIGLAASSGLRPREVICLNKQDVDWDRGILEIKRTKFKKDRIVPVHASTVDALREYASIRDAAFPGSSCEAFFINERGTRYLSSALESAFRKLTRKIGLRGPRGRGPTFGDLRHTFAVNRLVAWYREGTDVQAKLPVLATYMGHVEYSYTAYYITATTELRTLAQERLGQWLNGREKQQ